ncbi:hypothetical protein E2C01_075833 [Portunus trituberculatus]|uniref:Uncharacterized protein n=1 Tax=Portunus trituberculatus TaxID=210409 RepID=A0A5B7IGT3_PORTR|nr:hypothetical protein [Portunus trituberculatus]
MFEPQSCMAAVTPDGEAGGGYWARHGVPTHPGAPGRGLSRELLMSLYTSVKAGEGVRNMALRSGRVAGG